MRNRRTRRSDDALRERLAEIAEANSPALPQADGVRAQGDRRRVRVAVAVATVSGLIGITGVGVAAGMGLNSWFAGAPADSTLVDASASEQASIPSDAPTPIPSEVPQPSAKPSAPRSQSPAARPPRDPSKIPPGLSMLHEGEAGWTTNKSLSVPSAYNPCGAPDATATGRTDARTLKGPGMPGEESHSPSKVTHHLFLYGTEQAAAAAFAAFAGGGCGWARSVMNPGDAESTHLARLRKMETPTQQPGVYWLHDAVLVRTRNALLIAHADGSGAGMTSNLADQEVNRILKPLCDAQLICR